MPIRGNATARKFSRDLSGGAFDEPRFCHLRHAILTRIGRLCSTRSGAFTGLFPTQITGRSTLAGGAAAIRAAPYPLAASSGQADSPRGDDTPPQSTISQRRALTCDTARSGVPKIRCSAASGWRQPRGMSGCSGHVLSGRRRSSSASIRVLCTTSNSRTLGIRFRTATIRQSWHQTPARGYHASGAAGSKARKSPYADAGRWTQNTRMGRRLAWSFTADTARPNPGEPRRCGSPGPICVFCVHLPASAKTLACLLRPVPHRALRLRMAGAPHRRNGTRAAAPRQNTISRSTSLPRSAGASKSSTGPTGTIPVGLMRLWLM